MIPRPKVICSQCENKISRRIEITLHDHKTGILVTKYICKHCIICLIDFSEVFEI